MLFDSADLEVNAIASKLVDKPRGDLILRDGRENDYYHWASFPRAVVLATGGTSISSRVCRPKLRSSDHCTASIC